MEIALVYQIVLALVTKYCFSTLFCCLFFPFVDWDILMRFLSALLDCLFSSDTAL